MKISEIARVLNISDFNIKDFYGNNLICCIANEDLFLRPCKFGIIYDFELSKTENIKSRDLFAK